MKSTVNLPIKGCDKCPNMDSSRYYTGDSFEHVEEWKCSASANKRITLHEWPDKTPPIPSWCPLRSGDS